MNARFLLLQVVALAAVSGGIASAALRAPLVAPARPDGLLYVALPTEVAIYRQDGTGPVGRILNGISYPLGMYVDSAGTLYVANGNGASVSIYPRGHRSPSLVLSTGLQIPVDVAVDANGTVYVATDARGGLSVGTVVEYRAGQTHPFFTTPPYRQFGESATFNNLAVDANENVFVSAVIGSSFGQGVLEYRAGRASSWEFVAGSTYLRDALAGLAIDRQGHLVIAEEGGESAPGEIDVYDLAQKRILRKIGNDYDGANAVRFDRDSLRLFASDPFQATVYVYAYRRGRLVRSILIRNANAVNGIAVGPR